jgi:hypothetical protein
MWRCCICPDDWFTSVREYAMHVERCHDDWLEGRRIPPYAVRPAWVLDREAGRTGWL